MGGELLAYLRRVQACAQSGTMYLGGELCHCEEGELTSIGCAAVLRFESAGRWGQVVSTADSVTG